MNYGLLETMDVTPGESERMSKMKRNHVTKRKDPTYTPWKMNGWNLKFLKEENPLPSTSSI